MMGSERLLISERPSVFPHWVVIMSVKSKAILILEAKKEEMSFRLVYDRTRTKIWRWTSTFQTNDHPLNLSCFLIYLMCYALPHDIWHDKRTVVPFRLTWYKSRIKYLPSWGSGSMNSTNGKTSRLTSVGPLTPQNRPLFVWPPWRAGPLTHMPVRSRAI